MKLPTFIFLWANIFFSACGNQNPNLDKTGEDQLKSLELDHQINKNDMVYQDLIYVPIYSGIYVDLQNPNCLLAATLSIRNTSYHDSLFISQIDYFNTAGELVKSYIDNPISLPPMATVNYVVERDDDTGGQGANFIVALSSGNLTVRPVIQAIMIGHCSNNTISFSTDGYSIKNNKPRK
ncbi:MAG: DUF3124 domain-containing protein [Saprospiraceae bacterium]|nr:DUF3124 domain-containing protein [Saprospiraceae bacterium]